MALPTDLQITPGRLSIGMYAPMPSAQPFTQRVARGYAHELEDIRTWLRDDLIPFLTVSTGQMQWDANAELLATRVQGFLDDQADQVNQTLDQAVAEVIGAHILVTDPIIKGVLDQLPANSPALTKLHQLFDLSDDKLRGFFGNNNGPGNIRELMDELYKFRDDFVLELLTRATNSPVRNKLDERYPVKMGGWWGPNWGGDSGARIGDNGFSEGSWQRTDDHVHGVCRLVFGSTAIFGGSVLVNTNFGGPPFTKYTRIEGYYEPYQNGPVRKIFFLPLNSNEWRCFVDRGNGFEVVNVLGNPTQQSTMTLFLTGVIDVANAG